MAPKKRTRPHISSARAGKRTPETRDEDRVTIDRALSKLGYCSRTQARQLLAQGRVSINSAAVTKPDTWLTLHVDHIAVDSEPLASPVKTYLALNKPRGLITTRDDPEERQTVFECLRPLDLPFVSPIGRLDKASEGLLLFTNDTHFANALLDPASHLPKRYHVQIDCVPDAALPERLKQGLLIDGEKMHMHDVRLLRAGTKTAWLDIDLHEGRNRQIRRMLAHVGIGCLRLVRISIGPLELGDLAKGHARHLTVEEVASLRSSMNSASD